jgi:hypothetical protein
MSLKCLKIFIWFLHSKYTFLSRCSAKIQIYSRSKALYIYTYIYMRNFENHSSAPLSNFIQIILIACNDHSHIHIENIPKGGGQIYGCWFIPH